MRLCVLRLSLRVGNNLCGRAIRSHRRSDADFR